MTNEHIEDQKVHRMLGGSTAKRWTNCFGAPALIEQARKTITEKPSFYAAEGTVAHDVAAQILTEGKWTEDIRLCDGFEIEVTDEMLEAVEVYTDYVNKVIEDNELDRTKHVFIEQSFTLPGVQDYNGEPAGGTADCVLHVPYTLLECIDYKHGRGVSVEVAENEQAMFYLLGAYFSLPEIARQEIPAFKLTIVQPRSFSGGGVQSDIIDIETLMQFYEKIKESAKKVKPGAPLKTGEWCKFCPAMPICPAQKAFISEQLKTDFAEELAQPQLPTTAGMAPEVVARILDAKQQVEDWFEDIENYALSLWESGVEIPGRKVVKKEGNRRWKDKEIAEVELQQFGTAIFAAPKLLTPTQMEKVPCIKKANFKLWDLIERPDNGKALVPMSDKREAIKNPKLLEVIDV